MVRAVLCIRFTRKYLISTEVFLVGSFAFKTGLLGAYEYLS